MHTTDVGVRGGREKENNDVRGGCDHGGREQRSEGVRGNNRGRGMQEGQTARPGTENSPKFTRPVAPPSSPFNL